MTRFYLIAIFGALSMLTACSQSKTTEGLTPAEARAIAKEAYIYGYPMVDHYRIQHAYFMKPGTPEFKGALNQLVNIPRVYTPEDKAIQTPNSDTPYSWLGADLRAEPLVLTVPKIDKKRYYSIQFIDAYTHNFAYAGSRATGNEAGSYLLAGPNWKGKAGSTDGIMSQVHSIAPIFPARSPSTICDRIGHW